MSHILLLDADPTFGSVVERDFSDRGLTVEVAITVAAAALLLRDRDYVGVIVALALTYADCIAFLETNAAGLPAFLITESPRADVREWHVHPQVRGIFPRDVLPAELADAVAATV